MELYQKTFKLNFQAVIEMTQKTKEHLIKTKGEIVNVSSIVAGPQAVSFGREDFRTFVLIFSTLDIHIMLAQKLRLTNTPDALQSILFNMVSA